MSPLDIAERVSRLELTNIELRALLARTRQFIVIANGDTAPYVKHMLREIDDALNPSKAA